MISSLKTDDVSLGRYFLTLWRIIATSTSGSERINSQIDLTNEGIMIFQNVWSYSPSNTVSDSKTLELSATPLQEPCISQHRLPSQTRAFFQNRWKQRCMLYKEEFTSGIKLARFHTKPYNCSPQKHAIHTFLKMHQSMWWGDRNYKLVTVQVGDSFLHITSTSTDSTYFTLTRYNLDVLNSYHF